MSMLGGNFSGNGSCKTGTGSSRTLQSALKNNDASNIQVWAYALRKGTGILAFRKKNKCDVAFAVTYPMYPASYVNYIWIEEVTVNKALSLIRDLKWDEHDIDPGHQVKKQAKYYMEDKWALLYEGSWRNPSSSVGYSVHVTIYRMRSGKLRISYAGRTHTPREFLFKLAECFPKGGNTIDSMRYCLVLPIDLINEIKFLAADKIMRNAAGVDQIK